jgi:hypothetical protein
VQDAVSTQTDLDLWAYLSPFDGFQTFDDLFAALDKVHLPGFRTGVLIPTLYDDWTQAQVNHTLGAQLTVSGEANAYTIRSTIEARGYRCGGWSVPRATGDVYSEGKLHGRIAARFDYFVLNFEDGWDGFWTQDGRSVVDVWITGFWDGVMEAGGQEAVDRLNGNVGVTMVTNSAMMHAVSDDEVAAWTDGTNFDALEAYIPGDPGLDPDSSGSIWQDRLNRISKPDRPFVLILEQGDLPTICRQFARSRGVQIWTLQVAAQQQWPEVPVTQPSEPAPCDQGWSDKKDAVVQAAGEIDELVRQARVELGRTSARKSVLRQLLNGVSARTTTILG